jgi:hypothetical protein
MKTILIVEGNTKENNLELVSNNIETHTQSIHNSLNKINDKSQNPLLHGVAVRVRSPLITNIANNYLQPTSQLYRKS